MKRLKQKGTITRTRTTHTHTRTNGQTGVKGGIGFILRALEKVAIEMVETKYYNFANV